jgi:hypothetical protein
MKLEDIVDYRAVVQLQDRTIECKVTYAGDRIKLSVDNPEVDVVLSSPFAPQGDEYNTSFEVAVYDKFSIVVGFFQDCLIESGGYGIGKPQQIVELSAFARYRMWKCNL